MASMTGSHVQWGSFAPMTPVSETIDCYWWFYGYHSYQWISIVTSCQRLYMVTSALVFYMVIMLISGYCSSLQWINHATSNENANHLEQTLFRCESWKMKEVCHSTLLLVCHLMHFQKDPEYSICWIKRQLLRPSGMQNWKMSFLKEVGWFKECKSKEKLNQIVTIPGMIPFMIPTAIWYYIPVGYLHEHIKEAPPNT